MMTVHRSKTRLFHAYLSPRIWNMYVNHEFEINHLTWNSGPEVHQLHFAIIGKDNGWYSQRVTNFSQWLSLEF